MLEPPPSDSPRKLGGQTGILQLCCMIPAVVYLIAASLPGAGVYTISSLLLILGGVLAASRLGARERAAAERLRRDIATQLAEERSQRAETERAKADAEAANERTTRFFSAASHDLRQPVHALDLYMSLLAKNPPERERIELIGCVTSCVESLDRLFNALLGVSQASEIPAELSLRPVPLSRLIAQTLVQFAPEARRKSIELRSVPSSLWVMTDEAALGRILGNLVANAIRYTEAGRVLVGVRRRRDGCALVVADTGVGIAPEDQGRVFADFYQVDNPGRDRHQGFGLGLATVRRLCDRLGCLVDLRSRPGVGSYFAVRLECAEPEAMQALPEETALDALAGRHVLLVEDDPLVQHAMRELVTSWGMELSVCASGDEAMSALLEKPGERWHVLLDYRLPGENGLAIADRLRAAVTPSPAISLITGEADPAVYAGAADRGIVVLSKPVKPIRLRALLSANQA